MSLMGGDAREVLQQFADAYEVAHRTLSVQPMTVDREAGLRERSGRVETTRHCTTAAERSLAQAYAAARALLDSPATVEPRSSLLEVAAAQAVATCREAQQARDDETRSVAWEAHVRVIDALEALLRGEGE